MSNLLGVINNSKVNIFVDGKKKRLNNLFVYINGKIFNYDEIKNKYELESKNQEYLVFDLYNKFGLDFLNELDGNFAIVIYDPKLNKLYLIKDKLGNVFLYYYKFNNNFIFSTSLKLIMNEPLFDKKIDKQVLSNFLGYGYIYEPYTIFENTYKVKKGGYIDYSNDEFKENIYFDLYSEYINADKEKHSDDELVSEFEKLFNYSLSKRGNKNSQVGIFMSSGHDSTLLAKLSKDIFKDNVNTYTMGFENQKDEVNSALKISKYINTTHHSYEIKKNDIVDTMSKVADIYDEPFADPSILPCTYLFTHIDDNNDFILTGDSCDAVFAASKMYNIYNAVPRCKLFIKKIINILNKKRVYKNYSEMVQINVVNRFNYSDKLTGVKGKVKKVRKVNSKVRSAVIFDLLNTVTEKYKVKITSLSNYFNAVSYTPFYDIDILKKTFVINTNKLYRNSKGKYIFDKVLYKNIPKEYFSTYKKKGFGIPMIEWTRDIFVKESKKITNKKFINKQGLFDYNEIITLIEKFEIEPDYDKAVVIWCYYCFQNWFIRNIGD